MGKDPIGDVRHACTVRNNFQARMGDFMMGGAHLTYEESEDSHRSPLNQGKSLV